MAFHIEAHDITDLTDIATLNYLTGKTVFYCPNEQCHKSFASVQSFASHVQRCCLKKKYPCAYCDRGFNHLENHRQHVSKCQSDGSGMYCSECKKVFTRLAAFKAHETAHMIDDSLQCSLCLDRFDLYNEFIIHDAVCRSRNNKSAILACKSCDKTFSNVNDLITHRIQHKIIRESMPKKKKSSRTNKSLTKSFTCQICSKSFPKISMLERHGVVHTGQKPFECDICGKAFSQKSSLSSHKTQHFNEMQHKCDLCEATFTQVGNLRRHLKRVHPLKDDSLFQCPHCTCVFKTSRNLNCHISKRHSNLKIIQPVLPNHVTEFKASRRAVDGAFNRMIYNNLNNVNQSIDCQQQPSDGIYKSNLTFVRGVIRSGVKFWICEYCGREFSRTSDLVRHIRIHSGQRPYKCNICVKQFKLRKSLDQHMRTHYNVKEARCYVCFKELSNSTTLKSHLATVHGKRAYQCNICPKILRSKFRLKLHVSSHYALNDPVPNPLVSRGNHQVLVDTAPGLVRLPCTLSSGNALRNRMNLSDAILRYTATECSASRSINPHRILFTCLYCKRQFWSRDTLNDHVSNVHIRFRYNQCAKCPKSFSTLRTLRQHTSLSHNALVHNKYIFACSVCFKRFPTFSQCNNHLKRHANPRSRLNHPSKYQRIDRTAETLCEPSRDSFAHSAVQTVPSVPPATAEQSSTAVSQNYITIPEKVQGFAACGPIIAENSHDSGPREACPYSPLVTCDQIENLLNDFDLASTFQSETINTPHFPPENVGYDHQNLGKYTQTTNQTSNFDHPSTSKDNFYTYSIQDMDDNFLTPQQFRPKSNNFNFPDSNNNNINNEDMQQRNMFQCSHDQVFSQQTQATNFFSCPYCPKFFAEIHQLNLHILSYHRTEKNNDYHLGYNQNQPYEKFTDEYSTSVDNRQTNFDYDFLQPKVQRRDCEYCGKYFKRSPDLKRHLRCHTGEKPFSCQLCDRSFATKSTLKSHEKSHYTGARLSTAYGCSSCEATFPSKRALTKHAYAEHKKNAEESSIAAPSTPQYFLTPEINVSRAIDVSLMAKSNISDGNEPNKLMLQLYESRSSVENNASSFYLTVKPFRDETPVIKRSPYLFGLTENVLILDVDLLRDLTFKKRLIALSVNVESFPEVRQLAHFYMNDDQSAVNLIIDPCDVLCSLGLCINNRKNFTNSSVDIISLYCSNCRIDFANVFDSKIHFQSIQHNQDVEFNMKNFTKGKHKSTKNKQVPILTASFACIYCSAKFTTVEHLRRHISIHNQYADFNKNYSNLHTSKNINENNEKSQLLCI